MVESIFFFVSRRHSEKTITGFFVTDKDSPYFTSWISKSNNTWLTLLWHKMFQNNSKEKNKGRLATFSFFLLIKIQWLWGIENISNCFHQTLTLSWYENNKKISKCMLDSHPFISFFCIFNYLLTVIYSELLFLFSKCRNYFFL